MSRTMKLLPVLVGLAVLSLVFLFPETANAKRVGEDEIGAMQSPQTTARRRFAVHEKGLQWLGIVNKGEYSNPDKVSLNVPELEYPGGTGTVFLYTGGMWVGAIRNGQRIVSTCTDGNDGTGEYGPLEFSVDSDLNDLTVGSLGFLEKTKDPVTAEDQLDRKLNGRYDGGVGRAYLGIGRKEKDDDGDWAEANDVDMNGSASSDFDGEPGEDDDGDGAVDEETLNGADDDGDGLVDEDVGALDDAWLQANAEALDYLCDDVTRIAVGDANGDGVMDYDPEVGIDEDPAGDMSRDYIDNDYDGLFDADDPDYDGDLVVGSLDDDGDGLYDEDDLARAGQELVVAYADTCQSCIENADVDGFTPMGIRVLQHSYQWSEGYANDFIMMDFEVTNIGDDVLEEVCIGVFFDFDIGHITQESSARSEDDITYYLDDLQMAIGGDDDGDDGLLAAQFFGVRVIQTPLPDVATTYQNFSRLIGTGDPPDNIAKYNLIASGVRAPDQLTPSDWRFILAFGPLGALQPGETLPVTVAIINGRDEADIAFNGEQAKIMFDLDFRGPSSPDAPAFLATAIDHGANIRWSSAPESGADPFTGEVDFEGYNIWRSPDGQAWTIAATYDLMNGIGRDTGWPPPASSSADYDYEFEDLGLPNGLPAIYAVTAFDDGDNGDGINTPAWDRRNGGVGVLESGRGADVQQTVFPAVEVASEGTVDEVYVVPNPYVGSSRLEKVSRVDERGIRTFAKDIEFRNLPGECTIEIYTLSGDLVQTLEHDSGLSWEAWNLRTRENQEIVGGIYVYRVFDEDDNEHIGKFIVVK